MLERLLSTNTIDLPDLTVQVAGYLAVSPGAGRTKQIENARDDFVRFHAPFDPTWILRTHGLRTDDTRRIGAIDWGDGEHERDTARREQRRNDVPEKPHDNLLQE